MLLKDKAFIPSTSTVTYLLPTMKIFHSFTCSLLLGFDSVNSFTSLPFDPSHHHKSIAIMSSSSRTNDETSTSSTAKPILQPLPSLSSPQIQSHSTFLLDMWGVLHDGSQPYEGVLDAIEMLKKEGKTLVILSNSSKRREDGARPCSRRGWCCCCCGCGSGRLDRSLLRFLLLRLRLHLSSSSCCVGYG